MAKETTSSAWWTVWPMTAVAVMAQPSLLEKTISYWAELADSIRETTANAINSIVNTWQNLNSTLLTPLSAVYAWVKWAEFIDDKMFNFENKYWKFLWKTLWGIVWWANTAIAAPIWTAIATYKWVKWAWWGAIKWIKWLWNKWYPKKSAA